MPQGPSFWISVAILSLSCNSQTGRYDKSKLQSQKGSSLLPAFTANTGKHWVIPLTLDVLPYLCWENRQVSVCVEQFLMKQKRKTNKKLCKALLITDVVKKRLVGQQMKTWDPFQHSIFQPPTQTTFKTKQHSTPGIILTLLQILENTYFLLLVIFPFEFPPFSPSCCSYSQITFT